MLFYVMLIVAVSLFRFVPHPPNLTPILAVGILSVTWFKRPQAQFGFPLLIMCLSDMVIGFHRLVPVVYLAIMACSCTGFLLKRDQSFSRILGSGLLSSILFFIITNFGVWGLGTMYPKSIMGLMSCYIAAIPFFHNTVIGTVSALFIMFGLNTCVQRWVSPAKAAKAAKIS